MQKYEISMETLPNHIIFREAEYSLKKGKHVVIRVVGKSMEPFLIDGKDVVRITPFLPDKLHCCDVVLFKRNDLYCLHRIIKIKGNHIMLCGDGICQSRDYIIREDVIGILDSVIRETGGVVACDSLKWKIKSYIWMSLFPFRRYLLYAYRKRYCMKLR